MDGKTCKGQRWRKKGRAPGSETLRWKETGWNQGRGRRLVRLEEEAETRPRRTVQAV